MNSTAVVCRGFGSSPRPWRCANFTPLATALKFFGQEGKVGAAKVSVATLFAQNDALITLRGGRIAVALWRGQGFGCPSFASAVGAGGCSDLMASANLSKWGPSAAATPSRSVLK